MGLQQLKKQLKRELKQQELQTRKSNRKRWFFFVLVLVTAVALLYPIYREQQLAAPQRLFSKGIKFESLGKLAAAEDVYREIYTKYPQAGEASEALLKIARIEQYDRQDEQRALLHYLQLEHDYPSSPLVLPAREAAAQIIKYTLRDYSRAIEFYHRLLELDRGTPDRYYYEIADCYFRLKNYPQARIELETLLEHYPDSPLIAEVLHRRGGILLLEGQGEKARSSWQRLIDEYPESRFRILAELDLAKQLEEEGAFEAALQRYQQIATEETSPLLDEKIEHLKQRIAKKKGVL
jgi:tetratricopeptide (TPR) repeat protein